MWSRRSGTGGSERIRSALTRTIGGLLRGVPLQDAIDARASTSTTRGWWQIDWPGFPPRGPSWRPKAAGSRWRVSHWRNKDFYFGMEGDVGLHAVSSDGQAATRSEPTPARGWGHTGRQRTVGRSLRWKPGWRDGVAPLQRR